MASQNLQNWDKGFARKSRVSVLCVAQPVGRRDVWRTKSTQAGGEETCGVPRAHRLERRTCGVPRAHRLGRRDVWRTKSTQAGNTCQWRVAYPCLKARKARCLRNTEIRAMHGSKDES